MIRSLELVLVCELAKNVEETFFRSSLAATHPSGEEEATYEVDRWKASKPKIERKRHQPQGTR